MSGLDADAKKCKTDKKCAFNQKINYSLMVIYSTIQYLYRLLKLHLIQDSFKV
jgi:hypothetical protein